MKNFNKFSDVVNKTEKVKFDFSKLDKSERDELALGYVLAKSHSYNTFKVFLIFVISVFLLTLYLLIFYTNILTCVFFFSTNLYMFLLLTKILDDIKVFKYMIDSIKQ